MFSPLSTLVAFPDPQTSKPDFSFRGWSGRLSRMTNKRNENAAPYGDSVDKLLIDKTWAV